jgi:hypothetical protein
MWFIACGSKVLSFVADFSPHRAKTGNKKMVSTALND